MKDISWKKALPYVGLLAIEVAVFFFVRNRAQQVEILLTMALVFFGFLSALWDLRRKIIPNKLVGAMAGAWVLILVPQLFLRIEETLPLLLAGAAGFLIGGVVLLSVYWISRKGLGGGDVKLMAVSGLYLGASGVLSVMLYGSILAAITSGILILLKKLSPKDAIPLAPFLFVGMLLTTFIR